MRSVLQLFYLKQCQERAQKWEAVLKRLLTYYQMCAIRKNMAYVFDTCRLYEAGYDIKNDLDGVLEGI